MVKIPTAPPSDLTQQRKHVAALESERATLPARLRQASADGDAPTVMQLTTRREMLPVLIADGRAVLVPLEVAAVEEELDTAREAARQAFFEAEKQYTIAQASFLPLTTERQFLLQRRRDLQAQAAVRA